MNTNTGLNDIRELTMDETDRASGGNAVIVGIVVGYLGEAILDRVSGKGAVLELLENAAAGKKGKQKQ